MTQTNTRHPVKRIVLIGDAAVGKSTYVKCLQGNIKTRHGHRVVIGHGDNEYHTTGEIFCHPKRVEFSRLEGSDHNISVRFYELGGQDVTSSEQRAFVGDIADGVIVMFDLTRPDTIYRAIAWVEWLEDRHPEIVRILVANKKDLAGQNSHFDFAVLASCLLDTVTPYFVTSSNDKESQRNVLSYCLSKIDQ